MRNYIDRYRNAPVPVKAAFWFAFCNFSLKGISFVSMPLYTRMLSIEEYGRMSLLTSYESIFTIFATMEIYLGAFQRGILRFKYDITTFEQSIVALSNFTTIISFLIVVIFIDRFSSLTGISLNLYAIMSLYFLVSAAYNCWLNKKRFNYDYRSAVIVTIIMALLANFLPIVFISIFGKTANIKIISTLLISIIFCIPFWLKDFHPINLLKNRKKVKKYLLFSVKFQFPLVFHSFSYYILSQSDRVMIGRYSGNSNVAFYSVSYSFATVIILLQNSLNQVLRPWRYKKLENKKYNDMYYLSNYMILLIGISSIFFTLVAPEVFKFLFRDKYHEALSIIPPISISVFFIFLYTIFVDIESYYGKTNYIAFISIFCALLNIVLNYFGIKIFDYSICAYTTLVCYFAMSLFHFLLVRHICKNFKIVNKLIGEKFLINFVILLFATFLVINAFYEYTLFRYLILFIFIFLAYSKRRYSFHIIENIINLLSK